MQVYSRYARWSPDRTPYSTTTDQSSVAEPGSTSRATSAHGRVWKFTLTHILLLDVESSDLSHDISELASDLQELLCGYCGVFSARAELRLSNIEFVLCVANSKFCAAAA